MASPPPRRPKPPEAPLPEAPSEATRREIDALRAELGLPPEQRPSPAAEADPPDATSPTNPGARDL